MTLACVAFLKKNVRFCVCKTDKDVDQKIIGFGHLPLDGGWSQSSWREPTQNQTCVGIQPTAIVAPEPRLPTTPLVVSTVANPNEKTRCFHLDQTQDTQSPFSVSPRSSGDTFLQFERDSFFTSPDCAASRVHSCRDKVAFYIDSLSVRTHTISKL